MNDQRVELRRLSLSFRLNSYFFKHRSEILHTLSSLFSSRILSFVGSTDIEQLIDIAVIQTDRFKSSCFMENFTLFDEI